MSQEQVQQVIDRADRVLKNLESRVSRLESFVAMSRGAVLALVAAGMLNHFHIL